MISNLLLNEMAIARTHNRSEGGVNNISFEDYLRYCEDHHSEFFDSNGKKVTNIADIPRFIASTKLVSNLSLAVKRFDRFVFSLVNNSFEELKEISFSNKTVERVRKMVSSIVNYCNDINDAYYFLIEEVKKHNKDSLDRSYNGTLNASNQFNIFSYDNINGKLRNVREIINSVIKNNSVFFIDSKRESSFDKLIVCTRTTPVETIAVACSENVLDTSEVNGEPNFLIEKNSLTREFQSIANKSGFKSRISLMSRRSTEYEYAIKICNQSESYDFLYVVHLGIPKYLTDNGKARVCINCGIKTEMCV